MGIEALSAGFVRDHVVYTGGLISPYEIDAALMASNAYVGEYHRSNGKSTDAPWDWPKTARDREILGLQHEKAMAAITGG